MTGECTGLCDDIVGFKRVLSDQISQNIPQGSTDAFRNDLRCLQALEIDKILCCLKCHWPRVASGISGNMAVNGFLLLVAGSDRSEG